MVRLRIKIYFPYILLFLFFFIPVSSDVISMTNSGFGYGFLYAGVTI